ncbi:hypothetical protein [Paractinoplanes globisporus]|uniref:Uncharacterized protein n=1 Tax=Paractinoplanes globisporus TaxID=113565 RepID=A0ABW6WVY6_9ACTN|nr:hypothetical protein [Actinoplanes globisporus]
MTPRRLGSWVVVALFFTAVLKFVLDDLDSGYAGWLLPFATVLATVFVAIVLHETGHLLAALALRLKVVGVRIRYTGQSFVRVKPDAALKWLPARFVLWHLAGPAVDFALAVGLFAAARSTDSPTALDCLLAAALTAFLLGVGNLWPHTTPAGMRSDGAQVLRWLLHPSRQSTIVVTDTAALRKVVDGTIDPAALDAFIETTVDGRAVALAVHLRLLRKLGLDRPGVKVTIGNVAIGPATASDYLRLHTYAVAPSTPGEMTDALAPNLGVIAGLWQLHRVVVAGEPASPPIVAQVAAVRDALARRKSESLSHLVVAALVDLLEGRPAEARRALTGVSPGTGQEQTRALLIRAIAESALGDHAQADRLVESVRRAHAAAGKPDGGEPPPILAEMLTAMRPAPVAD